jgi:hypothetical protein
MSEGGNGSDAPAVDGPAVVASILVEQLEDGRMKLMVNAPNAIYAMGLLGHAQHRVGMSMTAQKPEEPRIARPHMVIPPGLIKS